MKLMFCTDGIPLKFFNFLENSTCIFFYIIKVKNPSIICYISSINIYAVTIITYFTKATYFPCFREIIKLPSIKRFFKFSSPQIIRVIITFEDNRVLLITLNFTLLNQSFFFGSYAFKKNGSRLIIRVLRYKFTTNSKIKNF